MKYNYFICSLLFISIAMPGNAQTFSGKLTNLNHNELIILSLKESIYYEKDTILADQEGNFSLELKLEKPGYIRLWGTDFRNEQIFIFPGANLHIEADCTNSDTFRKTQRFNGTAALYNNFLADLPRNKRLTENRFTIQTYQLPQTEFIAHVNRYSDVRDNIKKVFFNNMPASKTLNDFLLIDEIQATYDITSFLRSYLQFLSPSLRDSFYTVYIEPYSENQQEDWHHLASPAYRWFFASWIQRKFDLLNQQHTAQELPALANKTYYEVAPDLAIRYLNKPLRRYLAETMLDKIQLTYLSMSDSAIDRLHSQLETIYVLIDSKRREHYYRRNIDKLARLKNALMPGNPVIPFEMQDMKGNVINIAEFKGKVVYIDLWAGWCVPCIAEFPASRELESYFKNNDDIVFLTISLDAKEKDWKKAVELHQPGGHQLWIKDGFKSKFVKDYEIGSIPHYLLISREGKFIEYNAPRPGSAAIREILEKQ